MKSLIKTILGQTGSGKSVVCHKILETLPPTVVVDPFCEYSISYAENFFELIEKMKTMKGHIGFLPRLSDMTVINFICRAVWELDIKSLVIEELDSFVDARNIPSFFSTLIQRGRHKNINLICTSQRPALISRTLTSNSDICAFAFHEPRDVQYLQAAIPGYDPAALKEHEYFYFDRFSRDVKIKKEKLARKKKDA